MLRAVDRMDDGNPIQLEVTIDSASGSAVFDFTGTGPQVLGNWNARPTGAVSPRSLSLFYSLCG